MFLEFDIMGLVIIGLFLMGLFLEELLLKLLFINKILLNGVMFVMSFILLLWLVNILFKLFLFIGFNDFLLFLL